MLIDSPTYHPKPPQISVGDLYPFGMQVKERSWSDSSFSYRFSFNGYEREDDIAGQGSVIDFGARVYDSRLGKFFSVDPIVYPYWSPYQYDGNSPIFIKDILGMGVKPPSEKGSSEGEKRTVSEEKINIEFDGFSKSITTVTETEDFYWHDGELYEAGWYNARDYAGIISYYVEARVDESAGKLAWVLNKDLSYVSTEVLDKAIEIKLEVARGYEMLKSLTGSQVRNPEANKMEHVPIVYDIISLGLGRVVGKAVAKGAGRLFTVKTSRIAAKELYAFSKIASKGKINSSAVRFSQNSINSAFKDGAGKVDDLITGLRNGTVDPNSIPAIRIVEKDGLIFTLDNRRLYAFQQAGLEIKYIKLNSIPKKELFKFTTTNQGTSILVR